MLTIPAKKKKKKKHELVVLNEIRKATTKNKKKMKTIKQNHSCNSSREGNGWENKWQKCLINSNCYNNNNNIIC